MSKIFFVSLILAIIFPQMVFAAPAVSSVSGNVTHGQNITISGSGFGIKNPAAPLKWDDFEWGNVGDSLSNNGWTMQNPPYGPTLVNTQKYAGSKSAYNIIVQGGQHNFVSAYISFPGTTEFYCSYYIRWDYSTDNYGVFKLARVNSTTVYSGDPRLMIQFQPKTNWLYATQLDGSGGGQGTNLDQTAMIAGQWHRVEMYLKLSTPGGTANGSAYVSLDNGPQVNVASPSNITRATGITDTLNYLLLPFMWADNNNGTGYIWVDDVYVDNTQARVEICDAETWDSRRHCEIQIPQAWSDSSITAKVNLGALPDSGTAYLFVFDADNNHNAVGYPVTLGAVPDTTPPSAPTGVAVQ